MDSVDFSDPLVIAGGAIVAIILIVIAWYALSGPSGPYVWLPTTNSAVNITQGVIAGAASGVPLYVASTTNASGITVFGKANATYVWYADGGVEKKKPVGQGWVLPSSIGKFTWSPTLTRGVTLAGAPTTYVCRAVMANGTHPGYAQGGTAYITYGGKVVSTQTFEYLNIA